MVEVHVNPAGQLITLSYSERVDVQDMKRCVQEIKDALTLMRPGFRLLNDLSNLETMELGLCRAHRGNDEIVQRQANWDGGEGDP